VPDSQGRQPFPAWKRIDILADSLNEPDQEKVRQAGGPLPIEEYPGETSPDWKTTVE
jgi:hypothetical protein